MRRDQLEELFDNPQVVDMLIDIWDVTQAWDDAYDGDDADHVVAYRKAMINLPSNPFYHQYGMAVQVEQMYYDWMASNRFEEQKIEPHKAYMLRATWYRLLLWVVRCYHGSKRAEELAPGIYAIYGEKFEDYLEELYSA